MTPGTLAITLFEEGLVNALQNPDAGNYLILAGVLVLVVGGGLALKRWLRKKGVTGEGDGDA